jgi:biopolymer transport protein ExbD
MKYATIRKILVVALCITFASCSAVKNTENKAEYEVIVVRVPPFHDPSLTPLQNFYAFHHFLYPVPGEPAVTEVRGDTGTWRDLPHDDTLLHVKLSEAGEISINSEPQASVDAAIKRLSELFANRTEMGVYAPGTDRIVKAVGIRIPNSAKYHELIQIVKAVKESGADPIVLLLDGHLPYQIIEGSNR